MIDSPIVTTMWTRPKHSACYDASLAATFDKLKFQFICNSASKTKQGVNKCS